MSLSVSVGKQRRFGIAGRMVRIGLGLCVMCAGLLSVPDVRAETGITNVIDGVNTNAGASFTIGNTGPYNALIITNAGSVSNGVGVVGSGTSANSNTVIVTGSGSVWTNVSTLTVGANGKFNQMLVIDGGVVLNTDGRIGQTGGNSNVVVVTGDGSLWRNTGSITMGNDGRGNRLVITNNGTVLSTSAIIGTGTSSFSNTVFVATGGSWTNTSVVSVGGAGSPVNGLVISNGGTVVATAMNLAGAGQNTSSNSVRVMGTGAIVSLGTGTLTMGGLGGHNELSLSDNALLLSGALDVGSGTTFSNRVFVSSGAVWTNTSATGINIGNAGYGNQLAISNGGRVILTAGNVKLGVAAGSSNNTLIITGSGSLLATVSEVRVGSNTSATAGSGGRVIITDGGTLETPQMVSGLGGSGIISNSGGIYQFTKVSPTIVANTAGSITLDNGTIAYRGVTNANIFDAQVANISFTGNNTFRLDNASNTATVAQNYTFDTGSGATNYVALEMVNGGTLWRGARATFGTGGSFLASNTDGRVEAVVTNLGVMTVHNSTMTFASNVVISGSYVSDPSTNVFLGEVTLEESGVLQGGPGDLFDFHGNLLVQSTNNLQFELQQSDVLFSGGIDHTNSITGTDFGSNAWFAADNFGYGRLAITNTLDHIWFTSGNGSSSNALYAQFVDLLGSSNNVANLHAPSGFHIYYLLSEHDSRNSYLFDQTYVLDGGGLLLPAIPEPSAAGFILVGAATFACRRSRRNPVA